jgi:cell division protein FtsI (penicillin-binding protein 3)
VVVAVFLDEPKGQVYGGQIAAPAFREIAAGAMQQLGVTPSVSQAAAPALNTTQAKIALEQVAEDDVDPPGLGPRAGSRVPSVLGLPARRAIAALAATGLLASLEGEGRVISQEPSPGAEVPASATIHLELRSQDSGAPPR